MPEWVQAFRDRTAVGNEGMKGPDGLLRTQRRQSIEVPIISLMAGSLSQGILHHLGAAAHAELFTEADLVGFDGLDTQAELAGDFLVAVAPGQQEKDFLFPVAQVRNAGSSPGR